ncbi:MAG: hypothetical protein WC496_03745 [Phycisphaerae bacterium]|jgi:predicted RNA-binding protein with TRAM domain
MKRFLILIITAMVMIFACGAKAAVVWEENFDPVKTTWNEVSAYWTDLAGPTATLTENDPVNSYGVATSETITADVSVYSELVITSTDVEAGALYTIQIQEAVEGGAYANAVSYVGTPGTQIVNIAALMGWSGTKSFVVNIWIDGETKSVTFGLLQLREAAASEGWTEHFDPIKSTWSQPSATWTDLTGSTARLTESDPVNSYGDAGSEVITVDVNEYNELVIASTEVESGALYTVQIQEVGGSNAYANAVSYVGQAGTQVVDIAKLMGWSGVKSFIINIWIDGESKSVTFDLLQIRKSLRGQAGWVEDFNPIKTTWIEPTCYWTDTAGPNAVVTINPNPGEWWGVTNSEVITLDVNFYDELHIKTTDVESGCLYTVQIQEVGGAGSYADAVSYMGVPSENRIDIKGLMGWSGVKTFQINIWLDNGGGGDSTTFNTIEVRNSQLASRPDPIFWEDHFDPIRTGWTELDAYWTDIPGTTAILTEDNPYASYGKVESETLLVNLAVYPELTVTVTGVDTDGWLDVGVQEQGGAWSYVDVIQNITGPNTFKVNIANITGWSGYKQFRVIFWINGNGKSATIDDVRVAMNCGTDVMPGDYYEDCIVNFQDVAFIGESWMNEYDMLDLKDISGNWLNEKY